MFLLVVSAICLSTAHACEFDRTSGLFKNMFTNIPTTENFAPDTGGDAMAAYGDSVDVTFTTRFKIFPTGNTDLDTVTIHDNGMMMFDYDGAAPTVTDYDGTLDVFAVLNHAFATPLWFKDDSGAATPVQYKFTYKHLKASDMIRDGIDSGPAKCDLQRIGNIIKDCTDDGYRTSTFVVEEALIVTWEISDGTDNYYFQGILSINNETQTHISFLYSDLATLPATVSAYSTGYVTGKGAASPTNNAGVCPYSGTTINAASSTLWKKTNCRCGRHNQGIYTFRVDDDAAACGKNKADFITECGKDILTDNTMNFNLNCRPSRMPQDTCLELVHCADTDAGFQININVMNPPFTNNTGLTFLDTTDFLSGTITENGNPQCQKILEPHTATSDVYTTSLTFAQADLANCNMQYNAGDQEISFVTRIFDSRESEIEKAGNIYLKATCDLLPKSATFNVKHGGIPSYEIPKASNRRLEMFVANARIYENGVVSKIPTTAEITLGEDIYLGVGFDWGTTLVVDKVHWYGIYVYDCMVANNPTFLSTGTNRMVQLTKGETDGCVDTGASDAKKSFYMAQSFKAALKKADTTLGIVSDTSTSTFNFVQTSGPIQATKWLVGGSDIIYFQCKAKGCRNQAFLTSSMCWDVCANKPHIDYTMTGRRKRDVNETSEDPELILQTQIRVKQPPAVAEPIACISNMVAYSTMLALTVLLLVAMGVTMMLFVKLNSRQRKRV